MAGDAFVNGPSRQKMEAVLSFALAMVVAPFVDALAEQAPGDL